MLPVHLYNDLLSSQQHCMQFDGYPSLIQYHICNSLFGYSNVRLSSDLFLVKRSLADWKRWLIMVEISLKTAESKSHLVVETATIK